MPKKWRIDEHLRPSGPRTRQQLLRLERTLGRQLTYALIGCPWHTGLKWSKGHTDTNPTQKRCIWIVYCMIFHPERLRTMWDWLTWGHFAVDVRVPRGRRGFVDRLHRAEYEI